MSERFLWNRTTWPMVLDREVASSMVAMLHSWQAALFHSLQRSGDSRFPDFCNSIIAELLFAESEVPLPMCFMPLTFLDQEAVEIGF